MTALNNLLFRVSLLDAMSGPARNMMNTMDRVTTGIQGGFNKIGYGAAGLAGAAYSLDSILQPAKEMNAALGTVSSLGVAAEVLNDLNNTALKFSTQYGESAAEFVSSSYDIQSAISGLSGNELSTFTNASAILAKGTKADMGTITDYVGTMYGIFQKNADAMGKADWINMMAGQTAVAVNIFKTTGKGMSDAFGSIGASGQTMGVAMNEQMAVLGTLQATMSGSEAGTKYKAFLDGIGKAQKEMGLSFTDSQGKMLPMVDILQKIQGKYGAIDTVAKSDMLGKAFGTQEASALIKLLSTNIDGLSGSIAKVGAQTGLQGAIDMANAMTQPWDRASKAADALRIMLGQRLLVVMAPIYNGITAISEKLMRWSSLFPNISNYIGYAVLGVIGITAALSALSIIVGASMIVSAGFGLAWAAVGVILTPLAPLLTALRMAWMVMKMEMLAGTGVFAALKIGLGAFATQLWVNVSAIWAWNMALLSNPITWIVLGIAALIGLVAAAVIYWDTWTQAVTNWFSAFDPFYLIGQGIGWIIVGFKSIGQAIDWLIAGFQAIPAWWNGFKTWVSTLNPLASISDGVASFITGLEAIPQWWTRFKAWLATLNPFSGVGSALYSLMSGIQSITGAEPSAVAQPTTPSIASMAAQPQWLQQPAPGLLSDGFAPLQPPALASLAAPTAMTQPPALAGLANKLPFMSAQSATPSMSAQPIAPPPSLSKSQSASVAKGGLMSQINNADNSKSVSVGGITVNNYGQPVTGQRLADEITMAVG